MADPYTDTTPRNGTPSDVHEILAGDGAVLARFHRPRSTTSVTLAVVADPHVSTEATGTWKLFHRTRPRFLDALAEIEARGVDCLLIAGDLTENGAVADLDWVGDALSAASVPSLVVPGNHDVKDIGKTAFEEQFTTQCYPTMRRVGDVELIGLNTAMSPDANDEGFVSEAQLDWLDANLTGAEESIVVSHHNLPGVDAGLDDHEWDPHPPITNAGDLIDCFERHGVSLHLSGHVHVLSHTSTGSVDGLVVPPLSSFPQAYLLLEIDHTGTTVRCLTPAGHDGITEAYQKAQDGSTRSRTVSEANASLLTDLPMVTGDDIPSDTPHTSR